MMMKFGGYVIDAGSKRHQLPIIIDPNADMIAKTVCSIEKCTAIINMEHELLPEIGPYELTLMTEKGKFLLMLSEVDENGETQVRTLTNCDAPNTLITMQGEKYPAKSVVFDTAPVIAAFKEFALTGNVSPKLLT